MKTRPTRRPGARTLQKLRLMTSIAAAVLRVGCEDCRDGRLLSVIRAKRRGEPQDLSWAQLLEKRAGQVPDKPFLLYRNETITYRRMNEHANQIAHFLRGQGFGPGQGLGIFMRNSPRFLDLFFGAQKIGMYLVPVNPELKGDGLAYLINHSDIRALVTDAELMGSIDAVSSQLTTLDRLIVNDIEPEAEAFQIPDTYIRLSSAYAGPVAPPGVGHRPDDICLIMYTSGTTGPPKGVVYRYKKTNVRLLSLIANVLLKEDDVYYTYLALCHGNALFVTTTFALARKATVALSRKFSAGRFWDRVNQYQATVFNTIGSIIPILMKQPERPSDRDNRVRFVISAACPADMWEAFEIRFGTTLYEIYSAVDSGGKAVMNLGTAPVGSLGKPPRPADVRIVDENGRPVPVNTPGELLFRVTGGKGRVEYYKNPEASDKKSGTGWLHTGDLVRQDEKGFLYFVGRNTESMRKGGENVSAYEVEHVIMEHPAVEDVAVYAVPSDLAEDDIMAAIKPAEKADLTAQELRRFLSDKLARYAIPRYVRFVDEFPKTNSHRIIKSVLEKEGITDDTVDTLSAS
ncbi:ATP-dependent acyl-CoA ligase [Desulfatiferula olefinivorans]